LHLELIETTPQHLNHTMKIQNFRYNALFQVARLGIAIVFLLPINDIKATPLKKIEKPVSGITPIELTCESQANPRGIDNIHPLLSWILKANNKQRGQYQKAYRIQVATSQALLLSGNPDLWDSKILEGAQCNNISYSGTMLSSNIRCYWRVRVCDKQNLPSAWSEIATWETGLLHDSDWEGKWIGTSEPYSQVEDHLYKENPAPLFRKEFSTQKKIKRAVMYVSGLGYYEAYINGKRVGNKLLDPAWTDYSKRILYSTYDVTSFIARGRNCLGLLLGNGWYNPMPLKMWGRINIRESLAVGQTKFIMQLDIEYTDGTKDQIVSDDKWTTHRGPIIRNSIYLGEEYDARKEITGWNKVGLKTAQWQPVEIAIAPTGKLQSEQACAIVAEDTLLPVAIKKIHDRKYIVDFGRNFGGIIQLKAKGKAGTIIYIRYGELLYPDGSLNVMTTTAGQIKHKGVGGDGAPDTAYAKDVCILNGKGTEIFQPHFTFHGFRYAEITGYQGTLQKKNIKGLILCSNVPDVGSFSCSDTLINQIQKISLNTFRSNIFSVQSDCPHRERFGYGGDIVATCEAFMDNFNMSGFYEKTVNDFADEAQPDGGLTETAPFVGITGDGLGGKSGPVEWGAVLPVLLYKIYQYYGNIELIRQNYAVAKNWVDFMHRHAKDNIINTTIGDHESIDQQIVGLSATAFYYYNTSLLSKFAKLLDKQEDFKSYSALQANIKNAFIQNYLDTTTGNVGIHTAAAQAYALYFNIIPDNSVDEVLQVLLKDIAANNYHITSGIFGTKFLMEMLGKTGNGNIAYMMATQKTFPGWGYMIANGATTLWEHWALSENTYSHNHPMFGSISNWFYSYLAGIRPADDAIGYNKIIIQPETSNLQWAKATYNSVLGKVSSYWKKNGSTFTLDVTIPVNASATVYLPASLQNIRESNKIIKGEGSVSFTGNQDNESIILLGSGLYHFSATLPDLYK
jgi:alpha-L-rhamnosidase